MKTLEELLHNVYSEIKIQNSRFDSRSVPDTSELITLLSTRLNIIPFTIPKLLKYLSDASMLFSFTIVEEDRKNKIKKMDSHLVAEGPIISELKNIYSKELAKLFTHEHTIKYTADNVVREYIPSALKYNNTEIGKIGNIAVMTTHYEIIFERNILNYSKVNIEKKLKDVLSSAEPLTYFVNAEKPAEPQKARRATDMKPSMSDFINYSKQNSIEKTLALYGIDFYARVCFRDYNFTGLSKLIDSGHIKHKNDLITIKSRLAAVRSNSDVDIKLQNYASEINSLEKTINLHIKKSDG
jgi:hypothetical protein